MLNLLQLFVVALVFISYEHEAIAQLPPPYSSFVIPLKKHTDAASNPLYSVEIMTAYINSQFVHSNLVIDIDAPLTWHDCVVERDMNPQNCPENVLCTFPVSCDEFQCTEVRASYSYNSPYCPRVQNTSAPDGNSCTCPVNVHSPVDWPCAQPVLNYDTFFVNTSDGRNPVRGYYDVSINAACAPSSSFQSFPENITGIMAFSSSPYAFLASLNQPPLKRTFSLCFPSTSAAPGVLFYGNGPYYLLPHSDVDATSLLSYTPLLKNPDSFGYFISVNSIVIKTRSINITGNTNTNTKLSTIEPYTTLRTDIYTRVVRRFSMVTKRIPTVNPVAPFGLCFKASKNATRVPDIDLNIEDGKKWTISTANSIKQVTDDVACLAFVDGGATSEPAIVIGAFQFEDNFLLFDLENSSLGFSSSLLRKKTTCANFNFTMGSA